MSYEYKTHFSNGGYPLCGHACWSGRSPLSRYEAAVTCTRCLHILEIGRVFPRTTPTKPKFGACLYCGRSVMVDWDDRFPKVYWPHDTDTTSRVRCPMTYRQVLSLEEETVKVPHAYAFKWKASKNTGEPFILTHMVRTSRREIIKEMVKLHYEDGETPEQTWAKVRREGGTTVKLKLVEVK